MRDIHDPLEQLEVHDPDILVNARAVLDACRSPQEMQEAVLATVARNEEWRGQRCINLLAPEAPTSPTVRALLSAEVGIRAAEGHIGPVNRWFAGTQHIDEIEALCVELLKQVFRARYADHRLVASMIGNMAVYTALTEPCDVIMSLTQPFGGHSSNRSDGPAGVRGLKIVDTPFDPVELEVDLDLFRKVAPLVRPKLVALGASMTLFPFPLQAMQEVIAEWGGRLFFDGAHQLGLVAGDQFQDPLREGAAVMTGSAGKTFSGPQSGITVWDDPALTEPITHAIFPVLAATHQVNRVAALAASAAEMLAYGKEYMTQIVRNAQALGAALEQRGLPILGAHKGYTTTHQVIADVRQFGGGLQVAQQLARANIITNKNLIPADRPMDELPHWRVVMRREREGVSGDSRIRRMAAEHAEAIEEMRAILRERGTVSNRDFEMASRTRTQSYRGRKDSALALYYLWRTGEVMTHHREHFERVYALTETVAPASLLRESDEAEADRFLISKEVSFYGLSRLPRTSDAFHGRGEPDRAAKQMLGAMVADGDLIEVQVEGWKLVHYVLGSDAEVLCDVSAGRVPQAWTPLETTTTEEVVFLAPLDHVSARGRAKELFGFDYVWEVYKPEQQRRFGYYTLPVLWGDRLVARFDSKLDRTTNTFIILGLWLEDEALGTDEAFAEALARGFARFVRFLGASKLDAQAIREPLLRRRACASQEAHSSEG